MFEMDIKFVLSDLDGVIREYPMDRNHAIESKYGLGSGVLLSTAFEKSSLMQAVCGKITDDVWRTEIAKSLSVRYGEKTAFAAVAEWSDFAGKIDKVYLEYLESLFTGTPVAVLTNGTTRLNSDLSKLGIEKRFHKIFNSSEIGFCKPDLQVYKHVIQQLGCKASEIFFIDDSLSHIQGAAEAGMKTHHYKSFADFKKVFPLTKKAQIVSAVIRKENKFLLGKRSLSKKSAAGYWCPISGRIEDSEQEDKAVVREVFEEVGLQVNAVKKLKAIDNYDRSAVLNWWLVDVIQGEPVLKNDEHSEIGWFTVSEMEKLDQVFQDDVELFRRLSQDSTS